MGLTAVNISSYEGNSQNNSRCQEILTVLNALNVNDYCISLVIIVIVIIYFMIIIVLLVLLLMLMVLCPLSLVASFSPQGSSSSLGWVFSPCQYEPHFPSILIFSFWLCTLYALFLCLLSCDFIWCLIMPGNMQNSLQPPVMSHLQSFLVCLCDSPALRSVQQCTQCYGIIKMNLCLHAASIVFSYSLLPVNNGQIPHQQLYIYIYINV